MEGPYSCEKAIIHVLIMLTLEVENGVSSPVTHIEKLSVSINVEPATVYKKDALFESTGGVAKKKYPPNKRTQKLTEIDN